MTTPATVTAMLERDAFSRWMGVELISAEPGRCTLRMTVREEMVNGFGVTHGGIAYSFADSAMAFACNAGEHVTVAVDNSISYPAAIHAGDTLTAEAEEESRTKKLAFYRVTVRRDEVVVALFRGTVCQTARVHGVPPSLSSSVPQSHA